MKLFSSFQNVARTLCFLLLGLWVVLPVQAQPKPQSKVDFNRDIRPIVSNTCFLCHGPDSSSRKAKLRLDLREEAIKSGAIVPGKPEESEAYKRVASKDPDEIMPPISLHKSLTPQQIKTFRQWILEGAEYKKHWSYEKPQRPPVPTSKTPNPFGKGAKQWAQNAIDNFILARLEKANLTPQPEADKTALIRRVALDLTGLPPTPQEVDAFIGDKAPNAYEKVVDRLLASPTYGEHQARQWLDLARYADSAGYADDPSRTIWAYRDWVIKAFNENKPFDQFTVEQIAGDLLLNPTEEQLIATAFHRNTMTNSEGGTDDEEFRNAAVVDRVNTTMSVWMGTSMACAQCHTHKYDPLTQKEYFQLFAFFNQSADADKRDEAPLLSLYTDEQKAQRKAWESEAETIEKQFAAPRAEIVAAAEKWAREFPVNLDWKALAPDSLKAQSGTLKNENGVIASVAAKDDVYTIEAPVSGKLAALRLEALPDAALPGQGPGHAGGNFVVTRIGATLLPPDGTQGPKARFVRIELKGKQFLQLAEVQVFSNGENIAPRGEARQSSTYLDAEAKRAIDGNTAGEYDKGSVSHTQEGKDLWWEVDLKSEVALDNVVVWNRVEVPERLEGFRLVALDANRREVWSKENNPTPQLQASFALTGARAVKFKTAVADFTQKEFDAQDVISGNADKKDQTQGWAIAGGQGQAHWLSLLAETPIEVAPGSRLRVVIEQKSPHENHTLGRFRLSHTADARAEENLRTPSPILQVLSVDEAKRDAAQKAQVAAYYARQIAPELKPERQRLATLQKQIKEQQPVTVPIMRELPGDKLRKTQVQLRGSHLALDEEVNPAVPAVWSPLPKEAPLNRLTLARWLVAGENPLTARVVANRYWETLFGIGLVRTSEEFGSQGEMPTHPELLDWLATELIQQKWDVKKFLKMMVMSSAYRQSSKVTPQLLERDPENLLVSRGPRVRLSAETIRDQALAISGLLSRKMYGPPVRPLRPNAGLNAAFGGGLDWKTSDGEDRLRRALYTEWRRTSPYPSLVTFDAPNREVCTLRRDRTNTPLQALVMLNDPVYIEAAQSLARRIAAQPGTVSDKLKFAFRVCLSRPPGDRETQRLEKLYNEALATYRKDAVAAKAMATEPIGPAAQGADLADLAAWTNVSNVLMNLDETLMKR
ncbi:MAG TPA: DUF1553 domain-containing protein [Abditibacteriaceae bacterium]|jgi:hypothetical protein